MVGLGRGLYVVIMGLLFCLSAALGGADFVDRNEPIYWGTYTHVRCDPVARGCGSIGNWVSDDQSIHVEDIELDGSPGRDGVVRASFQPTGITNDVRNNIVHTQFGTTIGPWAPWVFCVFIAGHVVYRVVGWRSRPSARNRGKQRRNADRRARRGGKQPRHAL